ncbi:hypothetical protein ACFW2D_30755 [Streptomyces sp. NPDC058914]|uniref:hypothetical protein n=1 Tax=Streptomyces TaxID=1883 RepID=UPI0036C2CB0A
MRHALLHAAGDVRFVDTLPKGPTGKIVKRSIDRTAPTRDTTPADVAARRH